jgi:hypothetical protein
MTGIRRERCVVGGREHGSANPLSGAHEERRPKEPATFSGDESTGSCVRPIKDSSRCFEAERRRSRGGGFEARRGEARRDGQGRGQGGLPRVCFCYDRDATSGVVRCGQSGHFLRQDHAQTPL